MPGWRRRRCNVAKPREILFALGAVDVLLYAFVGLAIWFLVADVDPVPKIWSWVTSQLPTLASESAAAIVVQVSQ